MWAQAPSTTPWSRGMWSPSQAPGSAGAAVPVEAPATHGDRVIQGPRSLPWLAAAILDGTRGESTVLTGTSVPDQTLSPRVPACRGPRATDICGCQDGAVLALSGWGWQCCSAPQGAQGGPLPENDPAPRVWSGRPGIQGARRSSPSQGPAPGMQGPRHDTCRSRFHLSPWPECVLC